MDYIRAHDQRGQAHFGWLDSQHSFSFGHYYDPQHMGFSTLRVINDDTVQPGAGFETHGHQNMEIVSFILDGTIAHRDSLGHVSQIPAGEIQRMSAGTGIRHSEYNANQDAALKFLQIWILPNALNVDPSYEQKPLSHLVDSNRSGLSLLVSANGEGESLSIHADARIFQLNVTPNDRFELNTLDLEHHSYYLHVYAGSATINGRKCEAGDGIGIYKTQELTIEAHENGFKALWFELPKVQAA